jgi:hypothetical protein
MGSGLARPFTTAPRDFSCPARRDPCERLPRLCLLPSSPSPPTTLGPAFDVAGFQSHERSTPQMRRVRELAHVSNPRAALRVGSSYWSTIDVENRGVLEVSLSGNPTQPSARNRSSATGGHGYGSVGFPATVRGVLPSGTSSRYPRSRSQCEALSHPLASLRLRSMKRQGT